MYCLRMRMTGFDLPLTSSTQSLETVVGMNWRLTGWIQSFECELSCGMCDETSLLLFFSFFILSCYCLFLFSFLFASYSNTLPIQECWLVDDTRPWLFQIIRYSLLLRDKIQFIYSFLFSYFINRRLVNYHKILIRCSQKKEDLGRDNVCS